MSEYKIIDVRNNQIQLLLSNGIKRWFPLPIVNDLYPTGVELDTLLSTYNRNATLVTSEDEPIGNNLSEIQSLIDVSYLEKEASANLTIKVKAQRTLLMKNTDFYFFADSTLVDETLKQSWVIYRQSLRDITKQPGYPTEISWPCPPAAIKKLGDGTILADVDGIPKI